MRKKKLCKMISKSSLVFTIGVLFLAICSKCEGLVKIGALFDQDRDDAKTAFEYAVSYVNFYHNQRLIHAETRTVDSESEFICAQQLCDILKEGVAAIFGPNSPTSAVHVHSVLDAKDMPHIEIRPDTNSILKSLNIHPDPSTIRKALIDLVREFEWKGFTIIYESGPYLPHLAELLKMYDSKGYTVTARQLDLKIQGMNFRPQLRNVKVSGDKNIIIDCSIEILPEVLIQAQQVGLIAHDYNIIITCLDFHTLDLEPFQYADANITGLRLIDPEDARVQEVMRFFEKHHNSMSYDSSPMEEELPQSLTADYIRVDTALIFDAVLLFDEALKTLRGRQFQTMSLECSGPSSWKNGLSVRNTMSTTTIDGLTRTVKLDPNGVRTEFMLDLVELTSDGIHKIGTWNSTTGLNITRPAIKSSIVGGESLLQNQSFIVLISLTQPYGMLKDSSDQLSGNDRFEGFGIELIQELAHLLGFNYTFKIQEDGAYGEKKNGEWNGMIREIMDDRAHLAITDLTITSDREEAVDFTMPFMNLGISILYKKPTKEPPSLFSFMSPFSNDVWLYLGAAYLGVSLSLFILGRLSPAEWDNPYPCIEEPDELENQFSLANSMWFTIGALLQQGSEIAPKSPSTRTVASIWWFFTLIMVSSYTANLAAFLTVEQLHNPINNAEELEKSDIQYGAKDGGSTLKFFRDSDYPVYKRMYKYMESHPELLTKGNDEGIERVQNKSLKYAFLMESSTIEYNTERKCEITQIGGQLDEKGYGIAMKKNSPYRSALSEAVLHLQEQGKLTQLKTKWWKEKRGGGACSNTQEDTGAVALEVANVGGVFLLLILGCIFAIFINFIEFVFDVRATAIEAKQKKDDAAEALDIKNVGGVFFVLCVGSAFATIYGLVEWVFLIYSKANKYKVPFKEEFLEELKFVIRCKGNTKTLRHRKGSSDDSKNSIVTDNSIQSRSGTPKGSNPKRGASDPYLNLRANGNKIDKLFEFGKIEDQPNQKSHTNSLKEE